MRQIGIMMVIMGAVIMVTGGVLLLLGKLPFSGHLPGDIHVEGRNMSFHFPVVTCIVVSLVLTVVLNLIMHFFRK